MTSPQTALQDLFTSPAQRARLVRLCLRLTGDPDSAEDLAQETLAEAWHHLGTLRRPDAFPSWLAGIAANVCRQWHRRRAADSARLVPLTDALAIAAPADQRWERQGLRSLLEQATAFLTPSERQFLSALYGEDKSVAQIAAEWGLTANTAAARLYRIREALHHALTTNLRAEAAEFGLVDSTGTEWEATRLWCFRCGRAHLEGQLVAPKSGDLSETRFAVRCPLCDTGAGDVAFSSAHLSLNTTQVLGTVRGYKPAFRRVNDWWDVRIQRGLRDGIWDCWRCGGVMALLPRLPAGKFATAFACRARFACRQCGADFSVPASGLAFHSPVGQRFWQRHPRMWVLPERLVAVPGHTGVLTRYEDLTGASFLEVLYAADTLQPLQVWGDSPDTDF